MEVNLKILSLGCDSVAAGTCHVCKAFGFISGSIKSEGRGESRRKEVERKRETEDVLFVISPETSTNNHEKTRKALRKRRKPFSHALSSSQRW